MKQRRSAVSQLIHHRYQLIQELESGKYSEFWLATDLWNNAKIKLRLFQPRKKSPFHIEHEAIETWQLVAQNYRAPVTPFQDFGVVATGNYAYCLLLALPFVHSEPLAKIAQSAHWNATLCESLLLQGLRALATLHAAGCTHGNINLETLLVDTTVPSDTRLLLDNPMPPHTLSREHHIPIRKPLKDLQDLAKAFTTFLKNSRSFDLWQKPLNVAALRWLQHYSRSVVKEPKETTLELYETLSADLGFSVQHPAMQVDRLLPSHIPPSRRLLLDDLHREIHLNLRSKNRRNLPLMLLSGDRGIGKSTIIGQLEIWAKQSGITTHRVNAASFEKDLFDLLRFMQVDKRLLNKVENMEPQEMDVKTTQEHLLLRLIQTLKNEFKNEPFLIFCDNLDQASNSARELLASLIQKITGAPQSIRLLIIATSEASSQASILQNYGDFAKMHDLAPPITIDIPPLNDNELQLILQEFGKEISSAKPLNAAAIRELVDQAGGNPLLLRELGAVAMQQQSGKSAQPTIRQLATVTQLLSRRLEGLNATEWLVGRKLACLYGNYTRRFLIELGYLSQHNSDTIDQLLSKDIVKLSGENIVFTYSLFVEQFLTRPVSDLASVEAIRHDLVKCLENHAMFRTDVTIQEEVWRQRLKLGTVANIAEIITFAKLLETNLHFAKANALFKEAALLSRSRLQTATQNRGLQIGDLLPHMQLIEQLINIGALNEARELIQAVFRQFDQHGITSDTAIDTTMNQATAGGYLTLLNQAVRLHRLTGNLDSARKFAGMGLLLAEKHQLVGQVLAFASLQGMLMIQTGHFRDCYNLTEKVINFGEYDDKYLIQLLTNKAHCLRAVQDIGGAIKIYERAVNLAKEIGYHNGLANLEQSLGIAHNLIGNFDKAKQHFSQALVGFQLSSNVLGEYSTKLSLGQLHFDLGEISNANDLFQECLIYYKGIQHKRMLADTLIKLANLQFFVGHYQEAAGNWRFALWSADELGIQNLKGLAHWGLLRHSLRNGFNVDAQLHLDMARNCFNEKEYPAEHQRLSMMQGLLFHLNKDIHHSLSESLAILGKNNDLEIVQAFFEKGVTEIDGRNLLNALRLATYPASLRQEFIRTFLHLFEQLAQNKAFDKAVLHKYFELAETILKSCPKEMRQTFKNRWHIATFERHAQQSSKSRGITRLDGKPQVADLTIAVLQEKLKSLAGANTRNKLHKAILGILIDNPAVHRAALVYSTIFDGGVTDALLGTVGPTTNYIPASCFAVGLGKGGKTYQVRRDGRLLELYGRWITNNLTVSGQEFHLDRGEQLLSWHYPIRHEHHVIGFVAVDFRNHAPVDAETRALFELIVSQIALHLLRVAAVEVDEQEDQASPEPKEAQTTHQDALADLVCKSPSMQQLVAEVNKLRGSETTVLIQGESGTGKELLAKILHQISPRASGPWIVVDCGTVSEELFEAQFFGALKGAFTGAHMDRPGYFQVANRGSLFLDNIAALSLINQAKLLRVLQERYVRRVGAIETENVDVRIIVASQENLHALAQKGQFRLDLYYRLEVVNLEFPPLRERREDFAKLLQTIVARINGKKIKPLKVQFGDDAIQALQNYRWPGNVRELNNEVERLCLAAAKQNGVKTIHRQDLSPKILSLSSQLTRTADQLLDRTQRRGIGATLNEVERNLIVNALNKNHGNIARTAQELQVARFSLRRRMKKLGISSPDEN